ncbi:hypothetical protein J4E90_003636 [Alternaria incomplexa]|uniref:uncharacterized protein n=1 Tax=Alternaria incomplexa TaxID=1187928 RepID=UPI00221E7D26|nr:uncharacterized protein J4E90_003636 [Alternaria incomplexa]KAI4917129.1 hypothetical protein J4E90_003636 [Alternaria incomplexa]
MAMDLQLEETSQQSIAQTALAIPELTENTLNRLPDIRDLIHVRSTSKVLKAIVDGTPSIQRRLWQLPIPVRHDEDPHYPDLPQIMSTYPLKLSYQEVEWALEGIRRMEWDFYDAIEAREDEETAAAAREQQWERLWHPFEKPNYKFSLQTFFILTPQQHAFRCDGCRRLHPPYAASGLHPALRFLHNHEICGRGYGSELLFRFALGNFRSADYRMGPALDEIEGRMAGRNNVYVLALFARAVSDAYEIAKQRGILQHYFMAPVCTRLILACVEGPDPVGLGNTIVRDQDGIKLGQVLRALLRFCDLTFTRGRARTLTVNESYVISGIYAETWKEDKAYIAQLYDEAQEELSCLQEGYLDEDQAAHD